VSKYVVNVENESGDEKWLIDPHRVTEYFRLATRYESKNETVAVMREAGPDKFLSFAVLEIREEWESTEDAGEDGNGLKWLRNRQAGNPGLAHQIRKGECCA
jgi:hypothetical protein